MSALVVTVIPNYNLASDLAECLDSLRTTDYPEHHVIVVDNASTDSSVALIRERYPWAELVALTENVGYAAALNIGIRRAAVLGARYVFGLNNDTVVTPEAIGRLAATLDADATIGIASPRVLCHAQPATLYWLGDRISPIWPLPISVGVNQPDRPDYATVLDFDYVCGCAFFLRLGLLREIGLLDPTCFMYYEDSDLCRRARDAGYRVVSAGQSVIYHKVALSSRPEHVALRRVRVRNRVRFYRRYSHGPHPALTFAALVAQAAVQTARDLAAGQPALVRATALGWQDGLHFRSVAPPRLAGPTPSDPESSEPAAGLVAGAAGSPACDFCGQNVPSPYLTLRDLLLGLPGEFRLVRCSACGLLYLNPRPSWEELVSYYPPEYESHVVTAGIGWRAAFEQWARDLGPRHRVNAVVRRRASGSLLDVGCATGLFLDALRRRGGWRVKGVEPVESAAEQARQRLGLDVFGGTLPEARFPAESFDVVTMWDVLEHVESPAAYLRECWRVLAPGGWLVIKVPDVGSAEAAMFGDCWLGYDAPRHLFGFRREILARQLVRTGFRAPEVVILGTDQSVFLASLGHFFAAHERSHLGTAIHRASRLLPVRAFLWPAFIVARRLGFGSSLVLCAHKPAVASALDNPLPDHTSP